MGRGRRRREGSGLTCPILVVEVVETEASKVAFSSSKVVAFSDSRGGLKAHPTLCVCCGA